MDEVREKLGAILTKYFGIGDSYAYNLTRDKAAFGIGTMTMDDFEEFDADTVADIVGYLIANGVTVQRWIPVEERLPTIHDADDDNCVLAIHRISNKRYYHWRTVVDNPFDFTYWMRTPKPPKEERNA